MAVRKIIAAGLILAGLVCSAFAGDYIVTTQSFASQISARDTLSVNATELDTSKLFVQDKYNNKVISFVFDDPQNTGNNSGDEYNFKIHILQAVAGPNGTDDTLYLTPSRSADSVIIAAISPDSLDCDTTHFTSNGFTYYSLQADYTRGFVVVLEGLTGTRAAGDKPKAYIMVSQRKRL